MKKGEKTRSGTKIWGKRGYEHDTGIVPLVILILERLDHVRGNLSHEIICLPRVQKAGEASHRAAGAQLLLTLLLDLHEMVIANAALPVHRGSLRGDHRVERSAVASLLYTAVPLSVVPPFYHQEYHVSQTAHRLPTVKCTASPPSNVLPSCQLYRLTTIRCTISD